MLKLSKCFCCVASSGLAVIVAAAAPARATFIYTNPATPIAVPPSPATAGFFLDVTTGQYGVGIGVIPNPNIGIYATTSGGINMLHFGVPTGSGTGYEGASLNSPLNLDPGTYIGPTSSFYSGTGLGAAFHQSGTEIAGFKFTNVTTGQTDYGWLRVMTTSGGGYPAAIVDYGYDDSGAAVFAGYVPEPASLGVCAIVVGSATLRRRRAIK